MGRPRSKTLIDVLRPGDRLGFRRLRARWSEVLARVRAPDPRGLSLLGRVLALAASVALVAFYPTLVVVAAVVWILVLWPLVLRRRQRAAGGQAVAPRIQALALRYHGGHPALPRAGAALLRVWPDDGAAQLRVGRASVAFPLQAVESVTLVEGRVTVHTGYRGWLARAVGRLMAIGTGRFCGLHRHRDEDLAVIDRSRVLCDLRRQGRPCRLVLTGPHGGGEDVYLEALVLLRPAASWREAAGGSMGATTPPHSG